LAKGAGKLILSGGSLLHIAARRRGPVAGVDDRFQGFTLFTDVAPRRPGIGALGGLTLADVLRLQAGQPAAQANRKSVILIFLEGGASHLDTYDLKPAAPAEIRGEFKPIRTSVSGFDMCELMPRQAQIAQHLSVLRGVRAASPDHVYDEVFTAFPRGTPRPAFGSLVSRFSPAPACGLPAYVGLSRPLPVEQPLYAGAAHAAFRPLPEAVADLGRNMSLPCLEDRKALLHGFDTLRRDLDGDALAAMDQHTARALDILTADKIRQAFDLDQEPDKVRASYPTGVAYTPYSKPSTWDASNLLLARRLVERGVRVVTTWLSSWDQHGHLFRSMHEMLPLLDASIAALVTDLRERGLDLTYECETRMDDLDEDLIRVMHASGLRNINFGVESPDPIVLRKVARRVIPHEHMRAMIRLCWELGISTTAFYVIGFLQDTEESIEQLIQFAVDLDSTYANFKILTPYPGTPQFKQLKPLVNESDWQKFDGYTLNFNHPVLTPRRARLMLGMCYSRFFLRP
jgi:hypothetical protein